jgi:hypothetical protein
MGCLAGGQSTESEQKLAVPETVFNETHHDMNVPNTTENVQAAKAGAGGVSVQENQNTESKVIKIL